MTIKYRDVSHYQPAYKADRANVRQSDRGKPATSTRSTATSADAHSPAAGHSLPLPLPCGHGDINTQVRPRVRCDRAPVADASTVETPVGGRRPPRRSPTYSRSPTGGKPSPASGSRSPTFPRWYWSGPLGARPSMTGLESRGIGLVLVELHHLQRHRPRLERLRPG